jgi:hypothetical protein
MKTANRIILPPVALSFILLLALQVQAVPVQLSWHAPTTNADGTPLQDLAGYKVYYGQMSKKYRVSIDVGLFTSVALSGLTIGQTYFFAVTAYDTPGNESAFSAETVYTVPAVDTDGDGLTDEEELTVYGTDPTRADTDGDGIPDGVEQSQGSDPADPDSISESCGTRQVVFAVNAGGPGYTAGDGTVYQVDTQYSGGATFTTSASIAGTADDRLYQSERYGNFSYSIPVSNGAYVVTLKFAEIYWAEVGQRVFDVLIEGREVISNLDLIAQGGRYTAYDVAISVMVSDGVLNIVFRPVKHNAQVSAIIVERQ